MIRNLILRIARKKNPEFELEPAVSDGVLLSFAWSRVLAGLRAMRLLLYGHRPYMVFFGRGVRIKNPRNLRLGRYVQLHEYVRLNALGKQALEIGDYVTIGPYSHLFISYSLNDLGQYIRIGNHVGIGEFAHLGGAGGLEIGEHCIIGPYLSCHPENHNFEDPEKLIRFQGVNRKGIKIGRNCWIGAKVTILDGVEVGENSIIAAGAVVTKSMPPNSIIGGVPARVLKPVYPLSPSKAA